jgi:NAD(P)H-nitrite reductase large subunit
VQLVDGTRHAYDALLLATGSDPVRLEVPGAELPHAHYLRTLSDSGALVARALVSQRAVVIGASFIGLEVAASLRARFVEVDVVARDTVPMEKILGTEVGQFIRKLHEQHGVTFHLGTTAVSIHEQGVKLQNGDHLHADLVVVGIGVRPEIALAEQAGIAIDRGITVDEYLETSAPDIFAAGDRALARPAHRRSNPRRALGGGPASGGNRGAQHAWAARTVRLRAILLDRAVRFQSCLCRPR